MANTNSMSAVPKPEPTKLSFKERMLKHAAISMAAECTLLAGWAATRGTAKVTLAVGHYCDEKATTWSKRQDELTKARKAGRVTKVTKK